MKLNRLSSVILALMLIASSVCFVSKAAEKGASEVNVLEFKALAVDDGKSTENWTPAIKAAIEYAVANGYSGVYIPAGEYLIEGDTDKMQAWEAAPVAFYLPDADITIRGDGDSTVLGKGRNAANAMAVFRTAHKSDAAVTIRDIKIVGKHNQGSGRSLVDGIVLDGSKNTVIDNVTVSATKRHAIYAICGASYNTINNVRIDNTNRQMLGVGIQFEGAHHNTVTNIAITSSGANGIDFNVWNTGDFYPADDGSNGSPYSADEVYYSTHNTVTGGYISGTGIMNGGLGGGGFTCDPDDDYYGINLINGSDYNRFTLDRIENVRPESHNSNAAALRIMSSKNNIVTVNEVKGSSNAAVSLNGNVKDNNIKFLKVTSIVANPLISTGENVVNNVVIKDDKAYSEPDASLKTGYSFEGWSSYWTRQSSAVACSYTGGGIRLTASGSYAILSRVLNFDYPYVILKFRYRTNSSGASIGLWEAPWSAITSSSLICDEEYHYTSVIIPYTDGQQSILFSPNNTPSSISGAYLDIADLRVYNHRGEYISGENAIKADVNFTSGEEGVQKLVRYNLYSDCFNYHPSQLLLDSEFTMSGVTYTGKAPICSPDWVFKYEYALSDAVKGMGNVQLQEQNAWALVGGSADDRTDGVIEWQTAEISLAGLHGSADYGRELYNLALCVDTTDAVDTDKTYSAYYRDLRIEDEYGNIVYSFFNDSVASSQLCPQKWLYSYNASMDLSVVDMPYTSRLKGDINRDDAVTAPDLVHLRKILIKCSEHYYFYTCDVNGDDILNVSDLVRLKKLLIN